MAKKKETKYKQGRFTPRNPKKYRGDPTQIFYRSGWEKKMMEFCDNSDTVINWSSEEIIIPYISPIDNRRHRYFPDFYMEAVGKDGKPKSILIEIKPKSQTQEPKKPKRRTKQYITEVVTWGINQAKWRAAEEYCIDRGWEFQIMTESDIFRKEN